MLDATGRCIVRNGSSRIQMADVAREAGVSRSTVYRYFSTRDDLVVELMASRTDAALERIVADLPTPDDAASTLPELILAPLRLVEGNPLNEALFSPESRSLFVSSFGVGTDRSVDTAMKHFGPLLDHWLATGQIHADLEPRDTIRWLTAVSFLLLTPPWNDMSLEERREYVDRYLVRALVVVASDD